jgi:type II pantothenate kinase
MSREDPDQLVAGIDVGASTTKGVILGKSGIMHQCLIETLNDKSSIMRIFKILLSRVDDDSTIKKVAVSGGNSRKVEKEFFGIPVQKVDEIAATGIGGLFLSGKRQALIVSVGTGTAIIAARNRGKTMTHVGGTGVGGGTVMGLAKRMLGINNFQEFETLALKGNTNKVDLTVGDIVGGSVGIVPAEATASNFAKLDDETLPEDVAAGIFNLVSQVVGVVSVLAAKSCKLEEDIVFVGRLVQSPLVSNITRETTKVFGLKAFVPENGEYCTAVGAALYILRNY